jgi:hypothetical protein
LPKFSKFWQKFLRTERNVGHNFCCFQGVSNSFFSWTKKEKSPFGNKTRDSDSMKHGGIEILWAKTKKNSVSFSQKQKNQNFQGFSWRSSSTKRTTGKEKLAHKIIYFGCLNFLYGEILIFFCFFVK